MCLNFSINYLFQNCSLKIDDTSITGVRDLSQLEYNASIKSFSLHYQSIHFNDTNFSDKTTSILLTFQMCDLLLQNKREKLAELKKFNIDAKVSFLLSNVTNLHF